MPVDPRIEDFNDAVSATKTAFTDRLNRIVNANNRVIREFNERQRNQRPSLAIGSNVLVIPKTSVDDQTGLYRGTLYVGGQFVGSAATGIETFTTTSMP